MVGYGKKYGKNLLLGVLLFCAALFLISCGEKELSANELLQNALSEAEKGNWEQSEKFSSSLLSRDKNNVHALILQALAMHNTDRLQEAMDSISQAVRLAPGNFHAQYLKGFFACKAGKYQEAVRPLAIAHSLKSSDSNTLILLAQTHYKLRNDRLAVSYYKRLAIHPKYKNSALPVNALGIMYARSNPRLAERYFEEAAKRAKRSPHLLTDLNRAVFYESRKNKKNARFYYKEFLAATKGKAEYDSLRKQALLRLNDL